MLQKLYEHRVYAAGKRCRKDSVLVCRQKEQGSPCLSTDPCRRVHHSIRTKVYLAASGHEPRATRKPQEVGEAKVDGLQEETEDDGVDKCKDQAKSPKNIIPDELKGDTETSTMRRQMKEVNSEEGPSANKGEERSKKTMSYVSSVGGIKRRQSR